MKRLLILSLILFLGIGLHAQGTIVVWGNPHKKVADNVPPGDDFIEIAGGNSFAIALHSNGSLVSWGNNNTVVNNTPSGSDFIAISAGDQHAIALRANGTVVGWGKNNKGQSNTPPYSDFVKIAAGTMHNIGLRANGEVYAWGENTHGKCNVTPGNYIDIAGGISYSLAIKSDGSIVGWGAGRNGELNVPSGNDFVQISAKNIHAIARRADGTIVAWGNKTGNLDVPSGTYIDMAAGWQGNVAINEDEELVAWANLWVLKTIPNWVQDLTIVKVACGSDFNLGLTGEFASDDIDGDGVINSIDDFPEDPLRAYTMKYPLGSSTDWGTLAYEDLWPQQGDYEFNDLVLGYQINLVLDAGMKVKDINGDFMLRAVGANKKNAFAIEFPFASTAIETITSSVNGSSYDMPLIAAGDHVILKVISSTVDFVGVLSNGFYWNTQPDHPNHDPIPINFKITLTDTYDLNIAPAWGLWNPYLMVGGDPGHEIHLPGFPPTVQADPSRFATEDDTTDLTQGRYYKTIDNLPWALNLPISWKYPIEGSPITNAYMAFAPWAESNGTQYQNWYEMIPGNINADLIYNP